jgi:hypothetical protein
MATTAGWSNQTASAFGVPNANGLLYGSVKNKRDKAVAAATIAITKTDNTEVVRVTTDSSGSFQVSLPYGTYKLTCKANGYKQQMQSVTLSDAPTGITVRLQMTFWKWLIDLLFGWLPVFNKK